MIIKPRSRVLAIGAHPDDVEISCGGFLMKLQDELKCDIYCITCSAGEMGASGSKRQSEQESAWERLGVEQGYQWKYPDQRIMNDGKLVTDIEQIINDVKPDLVITHSLIDHHQDHIAVSLATQAALRNSWASLLYYQSWYQRIPFEHNFVVNIKSYVERKQKLLDVFKSLSDRDYMKVTLGIERYKLAYAEF